jgi:hypothetical protein
MSKLKTIYSILTALLVVVTISFISCRKERKEIAIAKPIILVASPITKDTLPCGAAIKGTMLKGHTYYANCDIVVNDGDTLIIQPGVTIIMLNPDLTHLSGISFVIKGVLICNGTKDNMITFTIPSSQINSASPDQSVASWGGVEGDSSMHMEFHWTNILYGGAKGDGKLTINGAPNVGTQYATSCKKSGGTFILEDCRIGYYGNDGVRLDNGIHCSIKRNTFEYIGKTGGEAVNIKTGTTGDIAYNVIWSSATNALKFNTSSPVTLPETNVNIYNNTIINNGFRNVSKPGNGVLFDLFTEGNVYNNIFVNCNQGLRISKGATGADVANTHYGNNLFYATDSTYKARFYPTGDAGTPQSSDLVQVDPMFVSFDSNIKSVLNTNDAHLKPGSPAIGKGNSTYNNDIGAYTSDGNGHQ